MHGRLALLTLGIVAVTAAACGRGVDVRDTGTRAVVIGIDGADWKIIDRLGAEGRLPNVTALRERSASGPIETLHDMPLSPVIWTSVATGKSAAQHGISWFMVDQGDGTRVPVRSHNRRTKAIWNILAENKRRPVTLGWWATYPAEDVGKGIVVSDALGFHGFGATARGGDDGRKTHPARLYAEVDALMPAEQQVSAEFVRRFIDITPEVYRQAMYTPARYKQHDPFNPIHLFQQYAVTAQGYAAIAEKLLAEESADLFMTYFEQVDSFSHLFIKYAPPRLEWIGEEEFARFGKVVDEWYVYQDEILGRLLAHVDLDTTAVFVLSDHGFKSGERRIRSETAVDVKRAHLDHETHGIFLAAGPHLRAGFEVEGASVLDITPTLLHYLGFPVAKDMDGKVLSRIFTEDFLERFPIRYVETYEDPGEDDDTEAAPEDVDAGQLAENMAQLRALGYIDGPAGGDDGDGAPAEGAEGESSPEIHLNMGRIHLAGGDVEKARREFRRALDLDSDNAEALLSLGTILQIEGRAPEAEHLVKRALAVNPNSVPALCQLAELRRDQGDLDDAIRLFQEALTLDVPQPWVYIGLGDVLQRAGRFDEAVEAFQRVLELEPDSFKAYYNLGVTYANQGRTEDAVAAYEKALEIAPNDPENAKAHNNLGAIALAAGDVDGAQTAFEQAIAAAPRNLEACYNLASIYVERDRLDEAVELLERAAAIQPNHEQVSLALGMTYLRKGRNEDAYRSFLLVRRLYPGNWMANIGLALVFALAERPEEAKGHLDEALRAGGDAARAQAGTYQVLEQFL